MKKFLKNLLFELLSIINYLIPKKRQVFIYGGDILYDNNEAMFDYLLENTELNIVCVADRYMQYKLRDNVKIKKDTITNSIYYSLTSKVVLDSFLHRIKVKPRRNQTIIQMWHGTPLKNCSGEKGFGKYYSKIFYPSFYFKGIYKAIFRVDDSKLLMMGNPRNDYLFKPYHCENDMKKIIWMPTYRQGLGRCESSERIPIINKDNVVYLNNCLQVNKQILYIKPHPRQTESIKEIVYKQSNIILIDDEYLMSNNIKLYSFIGGMDGLLTDYSSVYFDYLLLDRPIGFAIDDFEEYKINRGFSVSNPIDLMPGVIIKDMCELINFFNSFEKKDEFKVKRSYINRLANSFEQDNCKRCTEYINKILDRNGNE